jgi:hypothetical protein
LFFASLAFGDCSGDLIKDFHVGQYAIANSVYGDLRRLRLPQSELRGWLSGSPSLMHGPNGDAWAVWFVSRGAVLDLGFRVEGEFSGGRFVVTRINRADPGDEKIYFKSLANREDVKDRRLALSHDIMGCTDVVISGWAQMKLRIKHGLRLVDLAKVFLIARPERGRSWEPADSRGRVDWVRLQNGRTIRAIIAASSGCPMTLVSAFEVR